MENTESLLAALTHFVEEAAHFAVERGPDIEHFLTEAVEQLFHPKQVLRQLATISVLQVLVFVLQTAYNVGTMMARKLTADGRAEEVLMQQLKTAASYEQWQQLAQKLDMMRGHDKWREEEASPLYDCKMVKKRIQTIEYMLRRGDVFNLMFRLRGGMARDQFGIQHNGLFSRAQAGTKVLVEQYSETVAAGLNFVCDSPIADEEIPTDAKLAFFNETRHSYGRTALLLSGGAYLGFYHMGVVKALWLQGLLPRVISGASAGSIMTGIIGVRTEAELAELLGMLTPNAGEEITLPEGFAVDFFRFSDEFKSKLARRLNYFVPQGLRWFTNPIFCSVFDRKILNLDTEHLKQCLRQDIGLLTFQEAFDRTGRIINITVAPVNIYDPPRLLNYLIAPHVCVWSAVAASCALPGMFDSISLIVKEPDGQFRPENEWNRKNLVENEDIRAANLASYSDGSLENDLPMQQLSELFNVNHFIVSQVNPHSALLNSMSTATVWSNPIFNGMVGYMRFLYAESRDWLKNVVNLFVFRSFAPIWSTRRGFAQTLTQDYEGREVDVTINPWYNHISTWTAMRSAIKNPTTKELDELMRAAEAATWPAIPRIRAHCLVEMTLDKCVQRLRKRISDESHAVHVLAQAAHQRALEQGGNIDRTPSFYTSHSIVNLSGLSVADPAPIHVWRRGNSSGSGSGTGLSSSAGLPLIGSSEALAAAAESAASVAIGEGSSAGMFVRAESKEGDLMLLPLKMRKGSRANMAGNIVSGGDRFSAHGSRGHSSMGSMMEEDESADREYDGRERRTSTASSTGNAGLGYEDDGTDFLTLMVPVGDVLLHDMRQVGNKGSVVSRSHLSNAEGDIDQLTEVNANGKNHDAVETKQDRRHSWSFKDDHTIHKTTNMANFYYKKSKSDEQLSDLATLANQNENGNNND